MSTMTLVLFFLFCAAACSDAFTINRSHCREAFEFKERFLWQDDRLPPASPGRTYCSPLSAARRRWQPKADAETPKTGADGKKKKNKYSNFSKVQDKEDPLEQMIRESEQKLAELAEAEADARAASRPVPQSPPPKKMEFLFDQSSIDPYDPTTFGYVEIGTVFAAHGVHGWVKVRTRTDFPERLTVPGATLHIRLPRKRAPRRVVLAQGKAVGPEEYLVQLEGTETRDEAKGWRGATLYYATQQDTLIGKEDEEEYLVTDLVGFEVLLVEDPSVAIGTVVGIVLAEEMCAIPSLGQDLLEIELKREPDAELEGLYDSTPDLVLIPMVEDIVPVVDLDVRQICIDPPEGLLDLTYEREEKVVIKGLLPEKSSFRM